MSGPLNFGTFKAEIGQLGASVSVTLHFNSHDHADAYYDWLASQVLDTNEVVVRFNGRNVRQVPSQPWRDPNA